MNDPDCLEFHHRNPESKDPKLSNMMSYSWKRRMDEVSKCIVLCANCHAKEHARLKRQKNKLIVFEGVGEVTEDMWAF